MPNIPAPSMSLRGWVYDPIAKADQILSWFFVSRQMQDSTFSTGILSIQQILAEHGQNPQTCADTIETVVQNKFRDYYDSARVSCKVDDSDKSGGSAVTLKIVVEFVDNNTTSVTAWRFNMGTSVFSKIAAAVNSGQL